MESIGKRIKKIRELLSMTQKEAAERSQINVVLFRQYELDKKTPKEPQLQKIAVGLGVDIAFLQPSRTDTPFAILACLFDLIEEYGDVVFSNKGATVMVGVDSFDHSSLNLKLAAAMKAHEDLSPEDFKKWLINYPPKVHNGKIEKE